MLRSSTDPHSGTGAEAPAGLITRLKRIVNPAPRDLFVSPAGVYLADVQGVTGVVADFVATDRGAEPDLGALLAAFGELARNLHGRGPIRRMILSDALVQPAVVPWPSVTITHAEWEALARAALIDRHGTEAANWSVRLGFLRFGAHGLALGVDKALLDGLRALTRQHRLKISSVQAHFIEAVDRCATWHVQEDELLAVLDGDALVIALRGADGWKSIRCLHYGASDADWVRSLLEREIATSGLAKLKLTGVGLPHEAVPANLNHTATLHPSLIETRAAQHVA